MHLLKKTGLAGALMFCACGSLTSFGQTPASQKQTFATVSGRVTVKDKGATGVAVGLRRVDPNSVSEIAARAVTDQDGNYRMTRVLAGNYEVVVNAPAFVLAEPQRTTLLIAEGENIDGLNFALVRGGVITGRVTDADDRPLVQQQVSAYRADAWDQTRQQNQPVYPARLATTDDRGIYRFFGVPAGRYKVAAGRADDRMESPQAPGRAAYNRVFHPDGVDPDKATIIEVTEGSEATNIDISLGRAIENYSISGRAIDDKGGPVAGLRLALERVTERVQSFSSFANADSQGAFTFDNVLPGKYYVSSMADRSELYLERLPIEVIDRDLTSVVVKLTKGATMSGVVVLETDDPKALAKLGGAELRVYVSSGTTAYGGRTAVSTIGNEGTFRVGGLPGGIANVYLTGGQTQPGPLKGFSLVRLERDGVVHPRGIEIKESEDVTGVRAVFSYGSGVLRGHITVENGTLPPDSRFFLRLSRPGENSYPFGSTQADPRGNFVIENISTGVYELFVTVAGGDRIARRPVRQQVTITNGATTEVTVTFDSTEQRRPND